MILKPVANDPIVPVKKMNNIFRKLFHFFLYLKKNPTVNV